jgi:outer membrane receptor protein involved in Fe transport
MRKSASALPALASLLAVVLIPATLCGQTANTTPPPADQTPAPANQQPIPVETTPAPAAEGETVRLTPFEVSADQTKGYFTPNTTTGTRLANNVGDIPSEVTVIDKQQLQDTNSQNINDVMLYEAGTEGSRTYTPVTGFTETGDRMNDALAGGSDTANNLGVGGPSTLSTRVNGLGAPDNEVNNFYSLYRIPFDTYNVQSIEVDRGPNSLMFGSGSPAGIVNSSSTQAVINRLSGSASLQASSFGGYRETAELNIPLIRNHVALFLAQEFTSVGMQRQPSYDLTRRQYAAITIDPFKSHKTKITADAEFWNNTADDENTLLPQDQVTPWIASGKPMMNPVTGYITYLSTGKTVGPYVYSTTSPGYTAGLPTGTGALTSNTSPLYVTGITSSSAHFTEMWANGQFLWAFQPTQTIGSNYGGLIAAQVPTTLTASQIMVRSQFLTNSTTLPIPGVGSPLFAGGYASWNTPGVVDQNIYNSQNGPNIDGNDDVQARARTYHFDFQQNILASEKWGNLDADLAFFRQEFRDFEVFPGNGHNTGNTFYVDTNSYLQNGTPNPYGGSIYESEYQGDAFQRPEVNQNWRGMLTYGIDLRDKVPSWLSFLGHHRFMAEASTHDDYYQVWRFRATIDGGDGSYTSELYQLNNQPAIPGNWNFGESASQSAYSWQYLSPPGSTNATSKNLVTGIAGYGMPENISATTYNYTTGSWVTSGILQNSPSALNLGGTPFSENVQDQKTYYWQGFLWSDRIVGSIGLNDDVVKNRSTMSPFNAVVNGVATSTSNNPGLFEYVNGVGNPNMKYLVTPWNPFSPSGVYYPNTTTGYETSLGEIGGNTYSEGFVIRPFQNWSAIDAAANNGNIIAGVARTLGFVFNKSDNFNPPANTYTDLFGNPLGKPAGTEKDFGIEVATPDKKLYLRMTWFKSNNQNNPVASTVTSRELYVDQNEMVNWAHTVVNLEKGEDPTSTQFGNTSIAADAYTTADYQTMAALTGMNLNYLEGNGGNNITGGYSNGEATNTTQADGYNLEVTYNPMPNWTLKLTGGRQSAQVTSVDSQALAYQTFRMPTWLSASAPAAFAAPITNYKNGGTGAIIYVGNFWNSYGYDSNTGVTGGPGNGPNTVGDYFNNVVTLPLTQDLAGEGLDVPEETPYSWRLLTNYAVVSGPLKNLNVGGGLRWQSPTVMGYYGATESNLLNLAGQVAVGDLSKPIYTGAVLHADAWIGYTVKLPWDNGKIKCNIQLNCTDLTSNGYILPIQFNFDGSPAVYRIIPPRQWALTTRFSF